MILNISTILLTFIAFELDFKKENICMYITIIIIGVRLTESNLPKNGKKKKKY